MEVSTNKCRKKINLFIYFDKGFIWSTEDVILLRNEYHVYGTFTRNFSKISYRKFISVLPLEISMDEVSLAVRKGWAKTVKVQNQLEASENIGVLKDDVNLVSDTYTRSVNRTNFHSITDTLNKKNFLIPIFHSAKTAIRHIKWTFPRSSIQWSTLATLENLHSLGYGVRDGIKFGGEYLIYPGDPEIYHAQCLIKLSSPDHFIMPCLLASLSRCTQGVRKHLVLALSSKNKILEAKQTKFGRSKTKMMSSDFAKNTQQNSQAIEQTTKKRNRTKVNGSLISLSYITVSQDTGIRISRHQ
eukprot:gnl/TRDRNA2_/TRDRNA2_176748_c1_seq2.p1 gnl/TRDRNA2_/TRDRNA2_176748_c1~~gnl/TRDRNA2_/TRDRNA2_176748_c1_seq2.p1  ORF type:complete len:300 (-),score=-28.98 gnl/TRDRNA2_/TRDRNA2_176748_c1_seq2:102-1001(-)